MRIEIGDIVTVDNSPSTGLYMTSEPAGDLQFEIIDRGYNDRGRIIAPVFADEYITHVQLRRNDNTIWVPRRRIMSTATTSTSPERATR